jgi:hypothetical protein
VSMSVWVMGKFCNRASSSYRVLQRHVEHVFSKPLGVVRTFYREYAHPSVMRVWSRSHWACLLAHVIRSHAVL